MTHSLKIHAKPRISANDLARYMVSSDTGRVGIIKRSKYPSPPTVIRYKDARTVVCGYLTRKDRPLSVLSAAEAHFNQIANDVSESAFRQDDALKSIDVLRAIHGMANQLGRYSFATAPKTQPGLNLAGVEVSVRADLMVEVGFRSTDSVGAAILRFTQDDSDSEGAKRKRREMGQYVATLLRLHVEQNLAGGKTTDPKLCLSIDSQHGEAFTAPPANSRRIADLENACRFIAAMWDSI